MLIFCPECQRQLRVPDSAAGKSVKCPACAKVFAAGTGTSGEQIQAPMPKYPAPAPDSFEPEPMDDEPRARRKRYDGADLERRDEFIFRGGGEEAQRRANSGAVWFYVAAGLTMLFGILNTTLRLMMGALDQGPFGPLNPEERV